MYTGIQVSLSACKHSYPEYDQNQDNNQDHNWDSNVYVNTVTRYYATEFTNAARLQNLCFN